MAFLVFALWHSHTSTVVLRILAIIGLLFAIKDVTPAKGWSVYKVIPWLKKLKEYERERFKNPARFQASNKITVVIFGILVVIAFVFPAEQDPRPMSLFLGDWISLMCWLLIIVVLHWIVRKIEVDAEEGKSLKGITTLIYMSGFLLLILFLYLRNHFEKFVVSFMS